MNGLRPLRLLPRLLLFMLLAALVAAFAFSSPALAFSDVDPADPYAAAIGDLAERGIVSGYLDGTFGPDESISRCQFAKMIVNTLGIAHTDPSMPFHDVGPGDLPEFVAAAARAGITRGTDATGEHFSPWRSISRAQVITMVVRALESEHPDILAPRWDLSPWGYFDQVHAEPAAVAYANRLLDGLPLQSLDPWAPMPRGEVAQVLHNVLVEIEWDALAAVRALVPENIRMVEVRGQMAWGEEAPLRLLVPGLDSALIGELLAGVAAISPATDDPFDDGPSTPLPTFTLRTTDDRSLAVFVVDSGAVAINLDFAGRSRRIVGLAPAVADLAHRLVDQLAADAAQGNPGTQLPADMPGDFGIVAAYGVMGRNILDTFLATFTKDLISAVPPTAGTTLHIPEAGLREIYGLLREMDATSYPIKYIPPETGVSGTPYSSYYLRFRADGELSEIRWDNYNFSQEKRALDLLRVMGRIQELIEATDEYKALPPIRGGYM